MPVLSNWKTPVASPLRSMVYVASSSSGRLAMSIFVPLDCSITRTASSITSRLRRPRKSIFRRPSASTSPIAYCVTTSESTPLRCSGRYSISGRSPITTAAAWIESCRTRPSSGRAMSISCLAVISRPSSERPIGVGSSYIARRSWPGARLSSKPTLTPSGMPLAMRSTTP